ncbi:MAG TPA: hypothetical protein VN231_05405 [Allosphingosinicella sp.]|nr:hypothetical protein [Allosphingosinicella sp.]
MKAFAVVISGLLLSAPALAQASDGNTQGTPEESRTEQPQNVREAEAGEGGERRICRRVEDNTGSLTAGRRVCMTAQQWRNYNRRY